MGEIETAAAAAAAALLRDAAKEAAHVMAVAATTAAASGDHDSLVELRGDVRNMAANNTENHKTLLSAVADVKLKVEVQNGRVGKLESWRTQVTAIYGAILLAAPFVFFALSRWFGT